MPKTVLLIHGAWLTPLGWESFRERYEKLGYKVLAPPWPHEDASIERWRGSPDPALRKLSVGQVVDHYDRIVRGLPEPPVIIGHSCGALYTQKLLDRGLGAAGVALDPVPIRGAFPTPRVLRSALPVFLAWNGRNRALPMSFKSFATAFAQRLPDDGKRAAFDRYRAPTPGRLHYQGALGIGTRIRVGNTRRPPLLLVCGEKDITITPATVRAAFNKRRKSPSLTECKIFPGRSHFLFAEPGWEEVADYVIEWAGRHGLTHAIGHAAPPASSIEEAYV